IEAAKYNVFPLDDRMTERENPKEAGRLDLHGDRDSITFHGPGLRLVLGLPHPPRTPPRLGLRPLRRTSPHRRRAGPLQGHHPLLRPARPGGPHMTGPSSTPRGEHTPRPGVTWDTELVRVEQLVDDDAPDPTPPNRETRRALARAARRKRT